jgi:PKD repeat protein
MHIARFSVLFFMIAAFFSCKKNGNNTSLSTTDTTHYHIYWSYVPLTGVPSYAGYSQFAFTSDAPASATVLWNFGDGTTSTSASPVHIYQAMGAYSVTLQIHLDSTKTVTRVLDVYWSLPHAIVCPNVWVKDTPMVFHSNVLPDSTFYWQFGDGTTSTDSTPSHVYSAIGAYTVSLKVNGGVTAATKTVQIVNMPPYAANIYGTRNYHDTTYTVMSSGTTAHYQSDKSFAITYAGPLTISVLGQQLTYINSTDSMIWYSWGYTNIYGNSDDITAYYYHYTEKVVIIENERVSAGGATQEKLMSF